MSQYFHAKEFDTRIHYRNDVLDLQYAGDKAAAEAFFTGWVGSLARGMSHGTGATHGHS